MNTDKQNIILRWNGLNASSGTNESWYIRAIRPDGSFYGEIKVETQDSSKLVNVEGSFSAQDNDEIRRLVSDIIAYNQEVRLSSDQYEGLLATGPVSSPVVVLKYCSIRFGESEIATKFKRIIALMRAHLTGD